MKYKVHFTDGTTRKVEAKGINNLANILSHLPGSKIKQIQYVFTSAEATKMRDRVRKLKTELIPHYERWTK